MLRLIACTLVAAALAAAAIQFQKRTARAARRAEVAASTGRQPEGKLHAGAIGRWRSAVYAMWRGQNIYVADGAAPQQQDEGHDDQPDVLRLHPNMPFVVILISPLAYLPVTAAAAAWNALKMLALGLSVLALTGALRHDGRTLPGWVVLLALAWAMLSIIGDIQHGNTNVFVLAAVAAHLWLFRRGRDFAAGAALAVGVCLKMTPALFLLYWLYQRNWKLLAGAAAAMAVLVAAVPAAALGPQQAWTLTATWLDNLIRPGLIEGAWYPEHINQSLSGVASRYFLTGKNGDLFWNPEKVSDHALQAKHGWITILPMSQQAARTVVRLGQLAIVAMMAWAVGWRKLPRDDGRRSLHYGMVAAGMMLLNQRTWDHHATVMLIAALAVWYALGFGQVGPRARLTAFAMMMLAGPLIWLTRSEVLASAARAAGSSEPAASRLADVVEAYGPGFYYFLLVFLAAFVLAAAMRRAREPFLRQRQPLRARRQAGI